MTHRSIGRSEARVDAIAKVTGTAIYPGDRSYSDQLWMKILFAGRPHARIVHIDTREAEALGGVVAVLCQGRSGCGPFRGRPGGGDRGGV